MATVCVKILPHHLKADGTYNVKIRITQKRVKRYIDTEHFVTQKQLTKKLSLKDPFIEQQLNTLLIKYRQEISKLDEKLEFMNADQIRDHLVGKDEAIDFIKFCDDHIKRLKKEGRGGTASNQMTVRNSVADYFQHQKVSVMMITSTMLTSYEQFLRSERELIRNNQNKEVTITKKGLSDAGLHNHMRDLRTLFNAARAKYNDEELGVVRVPHYPFKKYKIGSPPLTRKRNLESGVILKLINTKTEPNSRAELAKELFLLSFLLCGIKVTQYDVVPTAATLVAGQEAVPNLGKPVYGLYAYKFGGLDPQTGNPIGFVNGVASQDYATITTNTPISDLVYVGPARPTYFGGLNNRFNFKGFSLAVQLNYKLGYYFMAPTIDYSGLSPNGNAVLRVNRDYNKRWQKPGDEKTTNVPSLVFPFDPARDEFYQYSTANVQNAGNIRLQDISLSYDFNKSVYRKLPFSNLQVFAYANNVAILWKANHVGLDPDAVPSPGDNSTMPSPRSIAIGVKGSF